MSMIFVYPDCFTWRSSVAHTVTPRLTASMSRPQQMLMAWFRCSPEQTLPNNWAACPPVGCSMKRRLG